MKLALLALLLVPVTAASSHLDAPGDVQVEAGNQVLTIRWGAVAEATGYYVYVYSDGKLISAQADGNWTLDVTGTQATYRGAVNGRSYAVAVAAHGADGTPGAPSAPVAATPRLARDPTYLAVGLIVVWAGLWGYVLLLANLERQLRDRIERLVNERRRHGDRP